MRKVLIISSVVVLSLLLICLAFEHLLLYRVELVEAGYESSHIDEKTFLGRKWGHFYETFMAKDGSRIIWEYEEGDEHYTGNVMFTCRVGLLTKRRFYTKVEPRNKYP